MRREGKKFLNNIILIYLQVNNILKNNCAIRLINIFVLKKKLISFFF